ncbi:hypothetical protein HPB50_006255 [Hyalomma asiaticum]|uniref:Uncharacterized protein n=1 Tax=Hyalomma asiaticum TaxID=266040 RepID=A0ACB7RYB8_HYAAI|nr:hypothetical protein HPB50_006255 [Hyalomma asiaticum]
MIRLPLNKNEKISHHRIDDGKVTCRQLHEKKEKKPKELLVPQIQPLGISQHVQQIGFGVLGSLRTLSFGVSPPAFITTGNAPLTSLIGLSSAEFGIRSPLRPPALGSTGLSFGTGGPLTRSITGPSLRCLVFSRCGIFNDACNARIRLRCTKNFIQTRWKSLRDKFRRLCTQLKAAHKSGAGAEDTDEMNVSWPYFEMLLFLKDSIEGRATSGNMKSVQAILLDLSGSHSSYADVDTLSVDMEGHSSQSECFSQECPLPLAENTPAATSEAEISSEVAPHLH